jgi:hypothetical protein
MESYFSCVALRYILHLLRLLNKRRQKDERCISNVLDYIQYFHDNDSPCGATRQGEHEWHTAPKLYFQEHIIIVVPLEMWPVI